MVIVHLAASGGLGGPESQLLGLVGALKDEAASVVLSFSEGGRCRAMLDRAEALGAEAVELAHNAPSYRAAAREVARHLRRVKADVLLCHGYKPDLIGLFAAKGAGVPVASVSHGWTAATWKVRVNEAADRLGLLGMARVVCVSEAQARKVRRIGVAPARVAVIRNAIDPEKYGSQDDDGGRDALRRLFAEPPRLIVGAAGRLSPEKGYGDFVEAAATLSRERPDVGFVHFGDGPLRAVLTRRVQEAGLGGRFVFGGFRGDLHNVFRHLDLFVLPSYTEGLPVVVLEAFASGVAVVATAVGGTPEVVSDGDNGRLVAPRNPPALARAIAETLDDDSAREVMGGRGRSMVVDRFSFAGQARAYQELFAGMIGTPVSGPPARA